MSAAAKVAAPRVAPAGRPAMVSPHHASERQARQVARKALRGHALTNILTPQPAARAPRLGDSASPLAAPLRVDAERHLGADLSAVRVHTDSRAAAFAASQAAEALTAGRDIYFAAGKYDPASQAGRELLLHELAHAIQQTGRRGADGRLAATPATGEGGLQRQEDPGADQPYQARNTVLQEESAYKQELDRRVLAETLKKVHRDMFAGDMQIGRQRWAKITFRELVRGHRPSMLASTFDLLVEEVAVLLGLSNEEDASWDDPAWPDVTGDVEFVKKLKALQTRSDLLTAFGRGGPGAGLLYDCFKKLGLFSAAFDVLKAAPRLKTMAWHGGMQGLLDSAEGLDPVRQVMARDTSKAMVLLMEQRLNHVVFTPANGIKPLRIDDSTSLDAWLDGNESLALLNHPALVDNELVYGVYRRLAAVDYQIENDIKTAIQAKDEPVRRQIGSVGRYNLSRYFFLVGEVFKTLKVEDHGAMAAEAQKQFGEVIKAAGERGMAFWRKVTDPTPPKFQDDARVRDDPTGKRILKSLADRSAAFFALEKAEEELPLPGPYQQRVDVWKQALPADIAAVDNALATQRALRDKAGVDRAISDDLLTMFYATIIDGLTRTIPGALARYSLADDQQTTSNLKVEDVRGAHRIGMAAAVMEMSGRLGGSTQPNTANDWRTLHDRANDWFMSRDRKESRVYLLTDWELSAPADSDLSRISDEVGDSITNWPVTGGAIETIFKFLETMERSGTLGKLLEDTAALAGRDAPTHRLVDRAIAAMPMPRRWEVKSYVFAMNKEANAKARAMAEAQMAQAKAPPAATPPAVDAPQAGLRIGEQVVNHPRTRVLRAMLGVDASDISDTSLALPAYDRITQEVGPYDARGTLRVFAWEIPSSERVVRIARLSNVLNQKVLDQYAKPGPAPKVGSEEGDNIVNDMDREKWLAYLLADAEGGRLETATSLMAARELEEQLAGVRQGYRADLKKAAVLDRRLLVQQHKAALGSSELQIRVPAPMRAANDLLNLPKVIFPQAQTALDADKSLMPLQPIAELHQAIATLHLADSLTDPVEDAIRNHHTAVMGGFLKLFAIAATTYDEQTKKTDEDGKALFEDALGGDAAGDLVAQRKTLGELITKLEAGAIEHQVDYGFRGEVAQEQSDYASFKEAHPDLGNYAEKSPAAKTFVRLWGADKRNPGFVNGLKHSSPLPERETELGRWHLMKVVVPFTYIPSFYADRARERKGPGFLPGIAAKGYLTPSQMLDLANRRHAGEDVSSEVHPDKQSLLMLQTVDQIDPEPLFADDFETLDELAHMVNVGSIISALQTSAAAVQFVMEVVMDVVTLLFGGVGQAAKTSAEILAITSSDEFQTLVEAFQEDPTKLVSELFGTLEHKVLEPTFLMKYLLFPTGGPLEVLTGLARGNGTTRKPKKGAPRRKTLFSKAIGALLDLGRHVAGAFSRLHERFQGPMAGLRGTVTTRPRLRWTIEMVAKYGPTIIVLIETLRRNEAMKNQLLALITGESAKPLDEKELKDLPDKEREAAEIQNAEAADRSQGLMETVLAALSGNENEEKPAFDLEIERVMSTLSQLELPKTIVPLRTLLGAIVWLIVDLARKSGAKGKIAGVAATVLQPVIDTYVDETAKQLEAQGLDPNVLWESKIRSLINEQFIVVRDETVTGLYGVIDKTVGPFREGLAKIGGKPVSTGAFKYGGNAADVKVTPIDGDYGAPLRDPEAPPPILARSVRLPASAGAPLDAAVRADAEERFGHDFKHVRVHAGGEGEAATGPAQSLALTSGSHVFLHPKISVTSDRGRDVLDHELTHVLQQTGHRPLEEKNDPSPRRGADRKGLTVDRRDENEAVSTARKVRNRKSDKPVDVTAKQEEDIAPAFDPAAAFDILALIASYKDVADFAKKIDTHRARKGKGEDLKTMAKGLWTKIVSETIVNGTVKHKGCSPAFFDRRQQIQAHLQGHSDAIKKAIPALVEKTWLTIPPVKSSPDPKSTDTKKKAKADEETFEFRPGSFAGALSSYVFVKTGVAIAIDLDRDPTDATKKKFAIDKAQVHYLNLGKVPFDSPLWVGLSFNDDKLRNEVAARMAALDPMPGVWKSDSYTIDGDFVTDARKRSANRPDAKKLPPKQEYLKPKHTTLEGLRVGTHKEFTKGEASGTKKGEYASNRESHHTTQFLLAQYFHNARQQRPFADDVRYPGVNRVGSGLSGRISSIGAIDVAGTYGSDSDRGGPMPAILIAAETHRQGRLHVAREGKWISAEEKLGSVTQGFAIDNQFHAQLPNWMNRLQAKTDSEFQKQVEGHSEDAVKKGIVDATNATYRWMYDTVMRPALAEALPKNELAYYRGLAAREDAFVEDKKTGKLKAAYDMTAPELDSVAAKADAHNKDVMSNKLKWVL